jgi:hypothetical protein
LLDSQTVGRMRMKIEEMGNEESVVIAIEYFILALVNSVEQLRQSSHMYIMVKVVMIMMRKRIIKIWRVPSRKPRPKSESISDWSSS